VDDLLLELIAEALSGAIGRQKQTSAAASWAIGPILVGVVAGLLSAWLFPHRLIATRVVIPGASLVLAPLATGYAMHLFGARLRRFGRYPSHLATFRGGALCAFSIALIRLWLVGAPR
jgi:ABC-type uncharacterized transport system permease subunit